MTRYFPELVEAVKAHLPTRCVLDAEIVVSTQMAGSWTSTPCCCAFTAASRVRLLATQTPAHLVAFDLLALGEVDWTDQPFRRRREALEGALGRVAAV
jgi:ATP-dependent DNA ligase